MFLCFGQCSAMKRAFLVTQNMTLAGVLKTDPVAVRAAGCPCYEKIALCCTPEIDPADPVTLLLCLSKSLMSVIYLVQNFHSKSSFHAANTVPKETPETRIGVC